MKQSVTKSTKTPTASTHK